MAGVTKKKGNEKGPRSWMVGGYGDHQGSQLLGAIAIFFTLGRCVHDAGIWHNGSSVHENKDSAMSCQGPIPNEGGHMHLKRKNGTKGASSFPRAPFENTINKGSFSFPQSLPFLLATIIFQLLPTTPST
jgi:hypothetical protein